jgi:hypothetical protein
MIDDRRWGRLSQEPFSRALLDRDGGQHPRRSARGSARCRCGAGSRRRPVRAGPGVGGLRGSAFGLLTAVQSLGNLAASAIAGLLWTAASPRVAFGYLVVGWALPWSGLGHREESLQLGADGARQQVGERGCC